MLELLDLRERGGRLEPSKLEIDPPVTETVRSILQRVFGRGVTLVFSAEETAREVAETLARKGIENADAREGAYRFLTTGDPGLFRETGRRFLQLPIEAAEHVEVAALEAAAA